MTRSSAFLGISEVLRTKIKALNANSLCLNVLNHLETISVETAFYLQLEKDAGKKMCLQKGRNNVSLILNT